MDNYMNIEKKNLFCLWIAIVSNQQPFFFLFYIKLHAKGHWEIESLENLLGFLTKKKFL